MLQALDADERATLWRLLTRALRGAEPARRCAGRASYAPAPSESRSRQRRLERDDRVDLDERALRQRGDADRHPRRRLLARRTTRRPR